MDCYSLPLLKEPFPQGSRCGTCRGCGFCEEVRILLPELIFTFPCELRTSPEVPSNFDDWDAALLQPLDFTIHNFYCSSTKWSLSSMCISSNGIANG
ncbi:hypothetical protein Tco_0872112 [Tanacetum coccineum]